MTNFEKWKGDILKIVERGEHFAVVNDEPRVCSYTNCEICDFDRACEACRFNWLYSEYKEPAPKLTKREWYFLTLVGCGYIVRDKDERLNWYDTKPHRHNIFWDTNDEFCDFSMFDFDTMFPFIKWEDEEPWKVEDLLQLEVEE